MNCIHITCPNCNKIFEVESKLIPSEGREVRCYSCENIWYYKSKENNDKIHDIFKKYPSELPKDLEDLISDAETAK